MIDRIVERRVGADRESAACRRDDVATLDTPVLTSPRAAVAAAVLGLTR